MNIRIKELNPSQECLEKYITLKEELLTLFSLENYIDRKRAEMGINIIDPVELEFMLPQEEIEVVD
jgi:hypothetical protein